MTDFLKTRTARPFYIDDVYAPTSAVFGAAYGDTPTAGRESYGLLTRGYSRIFDEGTPTLTRDEIDERIGTLPLKVDDDISAARLDLLVESATDDLYRNSIIARAKPSFGTLPLIFTAGLAATLTDPMELGLSLVPYYGQARLSSLIVKAVTLGRRASLRARAGVMAGVTGAVLAEPFVYFGTQDRQTDYTMYDSISNILFGGILGAGLHAGGGFIKDKFFTKTIAQLSPETSKTAFSTALKQMGDGRPVDVDHILTSDPRYIFVTRKTLRDIPDTFEPLTSGNVRDHDVSTHDMNYLLQESLDELITVKSELLLTNPQMKQLKSEIASLKHRVDTRKKAGKQTTRDKKQLRELESKLERHKSDRIQISRLQTIANNKDKFEWGDYPPILQSTLDLKLGDVHKARSDGLIRSAIRLSVRNQQQSRTSIGGYSMKQPTVQQPTAQQPTAQQPTASRQQPTAQQPLTEEADAAHMESVTRLITEEADELGISNEVKAINDEYHEGMGELEKLTNALKEWASCRGTHG